MHQDDLYYEISGRVNITNQYAFYAPH